MTRRYGHEIYFMTIALRHTGLNHRDLVALDFRGMAFSRRHL